MQSSTVGSLLRSSQAYCSLICEKETLDAGIAFHSERFHGLPEANQFREVAITDDTDPAGAYAEASQWFSQRNLTCNRWAPAGGQDESGLESALNPYGFRRVERTALTLTRWVESAPADDVKILPARAMRAALENTFADPAFGEHPTLQDLRAGACAERMNDPSFDMFLAMVDGKPAGRCALYQVGDIARITDLAVAALPAGHRVERALLSHVLAMAKRLAMRTICAQLESVDTDGRRLHEEFGFSEDGTLVEFHREPVEAV